MKPLCCRFAPVLLVALSLLALGACGTKTAGRSDDLKWSLNEMSSGVTAVLIQLRSRLDTEGTAPTPTVVKYDPDRLRYSFLYAVKQLNSKPKDYGFSLMDLSFTTGGQTYKLSMGRRAVTGAREDHYVATLRTEEDDARVVVFVTGGVKDIRTKVIAIAESHYSQRPLQLNCVFASSERGAEHRRSVGACAIRRTRRTSC